MPISFHMLDFLITHINHLSFFFSTKDLKVHILTNSGKLLGLCTVAAVYYLSHIIV